jgi:hypothetical protein
MNATCAHSEEDVKDACGSGCVAGERAGYLESDYYVPLKYRAGED